jgi:hypothetical protein
MLDKLNFLRIFLSTGHSLLNTGGLFHFQNREVHGISYYLITVPSIEASSSPTLLFL